MKSYTLYSVLALFLIASCKKDSGKLTPSCDGSHPTYQSQIKTIYFEIAKSFYRSRSIDQVYVQFCRDDVLRGLIFRYVFCYITLRLHRGFKVTYLISFLLQWLLHRTAFYRRPIVRSLKIMKCHEQIGTLEYGR